MDIFILGGTIVTQAGLDGLGNEIADSNYNCTSYISVTPGEPITISTNETERPRSIWYYANDLTAISAYFWWNHDLTGSFTPPNNCRYIRVDKVNINKELTLSYTNSGDIIFKYVPA